MFTLKFVYNAVWKLRQLIQEYQILKHKWQNAVTKKLLNIVPVTAVK